MVIFKNMYLFTGSCVSLPCNYEHFHRVGRFFRTGQGGVHFCPSQTNSVVFEGLTILTESLIELSWTAKKTMIPCSMTPIFLIIIVSQVDYMGPITLLRSTTNA